MGNAPGPVKEAADRVTASNDEEGIYITLKSLKFKAPRLNPMEEKSRKEDGDEAL